MKPKRPTTADTASSVGYDRCQTPPYAAEPLQAILPPHTRIWECAAGEGQLSSALRQQGHTVIESDLLTGRNFFTWQPDHWECIVTNPPYSVKYHWLERCYDLGKPFALLVPVEMIGAWKAQRLFLRYGVELLLLNRRVNFSMPRRGYSGGGAQFPVLWLTWQMTGQALSFATITQRADVQASLFEALP